MDQIGESHPGNTGMLSEKPRKRRPVLLLILLIVLVCTVVYLGYTYNELKKQSEIEQAELERQKVRLEEELVDIYNQYDSLKTENDTMNEKMQAQQENIERLLKINANNVYKIRMYEKELGTIRKVLRSYVVQIDSLNTANQELRAANLEARQQLNRAEKEKQELTQQTEELTSKIELASVLSAKNIIITPLNVRSREKLKHEKVDKIRVCFTLRENPILAAGPKIIYMRIARPDDVILASGVDFFDYEGEPMVYTASREVMYENVDVDLCIYWSNDGTLVEGTYTADIFADGSKIGTSSFALK